VSPHGIKTFAYLYYVLTATNSAAPIGGPLDGFTYARKYKNLPNKYIVVNRQRNQVDLLYTNTRKLVGTYYC